MDKEELIAFLTNNLKIALQIDEDGDLIAGLYLCGELISKDYTILSDN
jgi:hypothetical protein